MARKSSKTTIQYVPIPPRRPPPRKPRWYDVFFQPPYAGVPWLVLAYTLLACLIYTDNGPFNGHVIGFDDQVRMTQVLNFVNGAGWYDRLFTRVNAPEGFQSIWSRIVDLPLAAVVAFAQLYTDQRTAALVAVVVVPIIELIILFYVMHYFARPLAGKKQAWLVVLFLMFTTILNQKRYTLAGFHLGEASHHSWYVILNVLMFAASARVILNVRGKSPAYLTALAIALLTAVGIEGFPMIAGDAAIFGVLGWGFNDAMLARRGARAIGRGALLSLILLPMHVPPAQFFEVSFAQPSILGPVLVGSAAIFLAFESLWLGWLRRQRFTSLTLTILTAAVIGCLLLVAFPDILNGPAAALSPAERRLAANEHPESWPMYQVAYNWTEYIGLAAPIFIALIAGFCATVTAPTRRRAMLYAAYFGFAGVGGGMSQILWRYVHHAMTTASVWLLWLWQKIGARLTKDRMYGLKMFGVFVALGPFWLLLLSAMEYNSPFMSQVLFFPGKIYEVQNRWDNCDILSFADWLNHHYDKNTLIDVPDWDTASFLYNTDLRVDFLSNYPSHDKFIDNKAFFSTQDEAKAKDIARRHGFDLVGICNIIPMSAAAELSRGERAPMLIERLSEGNPPSWLKPVDTPGITTLYHLFAVDKAALAADDQPPAPAPQPTGTAPAGGNP